MKNNQKTSKLVEIGGSLFLLTIFILPFFGFASSKKIYVNDNASGTQDGTSSHPYKTINEAMKHAGKNSEIHIADGTYEESFTIKEGVEVYGEDRDDVIIKSPKKKYAVVTMGKNTRIDGVTVRDGKYGILVKDDGKATIIDCIIKSNKEKGVLIHDAKVSDSKKVSITDSLIERNDGEGIYSESRRVVLINNEIKNNSGDGVLLLAGTSAWINKNSINHNKSGMKLSLDNANVWIKKTRFSNNDREGIEINAYGASGKIDINDSKFVSNGRYGIARVHRGSFTNSVWNGVTIQPNNFFTGNGLGNVSAIIRIIGK